MPSARTGRSSTTTSTATVDPAADPIGATPAPRRGTTGPSTRGEVQGGMMTHARSPRSNTAMGIIGALAATTLAPAGAPPAFAARAPAAPPGAAIPDISGYWRLKSRGVEAAPALTAWGQAEMK